MQCVSLCTRGCMDADAMYESRAVVVMCMKMCVHSGHAWHLLQKICCVHALPEEGEACL